MLAAIILGLAVLMPQPAVAAVPYHPELYAPPLREPGNTGRVALVQIEGPNDIWAMRKVAKRFDRLIPSLRISTEGTCAENPHAICVRVSVGDYDEEESLTLSSGHNRGFLGLTTYPSPTSRNIYLNLILGPRDGRRVMAAHELGHALGLGHHRSRGVTGEWSQWVLSPREVRVLTDWYQTPRFPDGA